MGTLADMAREGDLVQIACRACERRVYICASLLPGHHTLNTFQEQAVCTECKGRNHGYFRSVWAAVFPRYIADIRARRQAVVIRNGP